MKSLLTTVAAAGVLLFSAMSAQAATYNFGGADGTAASYVVSATGGSGPDVTATIMRESGGSVVASANALLVRRGNGIGARYPGDSDGSDVDGNGRDEVVVLNFASAVQLVSATFSRFGGNDDFTLWFDNDNNGSLEGDDRIGSSGNGNIVFSGTYIGTLFGFEASSSNDEWRLKSVGANAISAVPLPAALPLYGAGLAVLGFVGWRKRRKAAAQA